MSHVGVTKVQGGGVLVQLGTWRGRNVVLLQTLDKAKREEGSFGSETSERGITKSIISCDKHSERGRLICKPMNPAWQHRAKENEDIWMLRHETWKYHDAIVSHCCLIDDNN